MSTRQRQASSGDILGLVQQALDEFDVVSAEATVRRTVRIANLVGDTMSALRLAMDLKASGGHPPANAEMTRRLMADPEEWGMPDSVVEQAIELWMTERQMADGNILGHSLAEIAFWQAHDIDISESTRSTYESLLSSNLKMVEVLARTKHHAFTLLCKWERELTFATTQEDTLAAVRSRVDGLLSRQAPDALDMFNAAFRRLRDAVGRDSAADASEELSQALTSCRRILKEVVDVVQPVDPVKPKSDDGHDLTDDKYMNRLVEFLKQKVESATFRGALVRSGESLFERYGSTDNLASKGVHAKVMAEEAEFCALHTYLMAGEVLLLADAASAD